MVKQSRFPAGGKMLLIYPALVALGVAYGIGCVGLLAWGLSSFS